MINVKMSIKHNIVFVLLAIVAVQGVTAAAGTKHFDLQKADPFLIEIVGQAIDKLIQLVRDAIAAAVNTLRSILDAIINTAQAIVDEAIQAIQAEIQRIHEVITQIQQQAEELGVNIQECLEENVPQLDAIPGNTIANLIKCVTNQVNEARAIIEGAVNDINDILDTVMGLPDDLANCLNTWRPVSCILNLLTEVTEAIESIPQVIANRVKEAIELVANIEDNMRNCAVRAVAQAAADAALVGVHVAECVANKTASVQPNPNLLTQIKG